MYCSGRADLVVENDIYDFEKQVQSVLNIYLMLLWMLFIILVDCLDINNDVWKFSLIIWILLWLHD